MKIYYIDDCIKNNLSIKIINNIFESYSLSNLKEVKYNLDYQIETNNLTNKDEIFIFKHEKSFSYATNNEWKYWKKSLDCYKLSKYKKFLGL